MTAAEPLTFGALLSRYRAAALLTQEQLAEQAGLSARGVSDLERGIKGRPRAYTVRQLSDALRLSADDRATFEQAANAAGVESRSDSALPEGNFLGALPACPLVARDEEVERISAILDAVSDGAGHLLLLGGEMGSGKTRLLQHVMVEARDRSFEVLTGRCYSAERATPFYPVLEALGGLDAHLPAGSREARRAWQRIQQLVGEYAADSSTRRAVAQQKILSAVSDLLLLVARSRPVAVLLDDLDWADADTLKLLQHLAHATRASPVLLAGSFRDVGLSEQHPDLALLLHDLSRERLIERATVRRLSLEETTQLVAATMGQPEVCEEFASFVYRRTKGNPRLIDQLVRSLGGRLELQGEIGVGSTGRVFRAFDRTLEQPVAAKLVLARTAIELDSLMRFQQEGAVLAKLDHPNIVRIHDTFAEEHASCIIMELLEGQSLGQVLQDGPLSLARSRALALQVADALAYAHAQQIVHRDIKPDNVMVLPGDRVKVTDFGIARILQPDRSLHTMATTGMRMGTPLYMAPEQIEGKPIDGRTDIYALGAMLYHMVTGRPPFDESDVLVIVVKQLQEEPVPPSSINPSIPAVWESVILKALAKDAAKRFQSAGEMKKAVEKLDVPAPAEAESTQDQRALTDVETAPSSEDPSQAVPRQGVDERPVWPAATHRGTLLPRPLILGGPIALLLAIGGLIFAMRSGVSGEGKLLARLVATWSIPAPSASGLKAPAAVAVDRRGVVYVADSGADRIDTFSSRGRLLSSWGTPGRGPGQLRGPQGVAVDGLGHVYVADTGNDRIEKFSAGGRFLASFGTRGTRRGQFRSPQGVAIDTSGTILVADTGNGRVQALTPAGTPLSYWDTAGTQRGKLFRPNDLAVFARGLVLVTDPPAGQVHTLAVDGSFLWHSVSLPPPEFFTPTAVDIQNGLDIWYILDTGLQNIRKYDGNGRVLQTWHGHFRSARGLAVDAEGNLYVADTGNHRILKFAPKGTLVASWNGASKAQQSAPSPQALARDARGDLYVADSHGNQIVVLSPTGHVLNRWRGGGSAGPLNQPSGIAVDASGNVYVADTQQNRIVRFSSSGTVEAGWIQSGVYPGPFDHPHGVRVDTHGHVYVADTFNNRVEELTSTGAYLQVWYVPVIPPKRGTQNFPYSFCSRVYTCGQWNGLAIDLRGYVYVTDTLHNLVFKLSPLGVVLAKFGGTGSHPGQLRNPEGVAVSGSGTIYVADTGNHRVEVFTPSGKVLGTIRDGLDEPSDVLVTERSGAAGILYVADSGSGRILQFSIVS